MAKTYREVLLWASSFLEKHGIEGYAIQHVFLARKKWNKTQWLLKMNDEVTPAEDNQIQADVQQLMKHVPPQYLTGFEEFYGRNFSVTSDTLIPRPETEELVEWCLQNHQNQPLTVVDVGTGTGAIAATLKLERSNWQVIAVDISQEALDVAQKNIKELGAEVTCLISDVLQTVEGPIDLLVSNPPYISEDEWGEMDESVRLYEPKTALFASNKGLAVYEKLADQAKEKLAVKGEIFLEIGYQQGEAVQSIFQEAFPLKKVVIKKDLSGNDRMVRVY